MRLLSLHEPWASLMALQFKRVETRDWDTAYRGPLAIHASKHGMSLQDTLDTCLDPVFFNALQAYEPFRSAILPHCSNGVTHPNHIPKQAMKTAFPNRGKILCIVNLVAIWPTQTFDGRHPGILTTVERAFGNYDAIDSKSGRPRQGWLTEFIFRLPEPIEFYSKQGLVEVPEEIRQELKRQWRAANP